jgi:hypothetical protein
MFPGEQIIPPSIKVATLVLSICPCLVGSGAWTVTGKYRLIVDSAHERNVYLRKEPTADEIEHARLLLWKFWQSTKTVICLYISVLSFAIPHRIADLKHFLIKEADSPYELNGKRIWMLQELSSLRIEDTTRKPV